MWLLFSLPVSLEGPHIIKNSDWEPWYKLHIPVKPEEVMRRLQEAKDVSVFDIHEVLIQQMFEEEFEGERPEIGVYIDVESIDLSEDDEGLMYYSPFSRYKKKRGGTFWFYERIHV